MHRRDAEGTEIKEINELTGTIIGADGIILSSECSLRLRGGLKRWRIHGR